MICAFAKGYTGVLVQVIFAIAMHTSLLVWLYGKKDTNEFEIEEIIFRRWLIANKTLLNPLILDNVLLIFWILFLWNEIGYERQKCLSLTFVLHLKEERVK